MTSIPEGSPSSPFVTRERDLLFLMLAAIFIASLVSCNLIFQKFFFWDPFGWYRFELSVGLLPYPITFLVTDLLCELYGKKAAQDVVLSGFVASIFISFVISVALVLPATEWSPVSEALFAQVFQLNGPAVFASMTAYLLAQSLDVRLFHFWKRITKGKHLWIRNNFSTIASQLVDTSAVLLLLCMTGTLEWNSFFPLLGSGYLFKVLVAVVDTPFLYLFVFFFRKKPSSGAS
ncbi:queuosine precursor transporter [bacterium]|nr:queuosine precursor transporter [bacterium]